MKIKIGRWVGFVYALVCVFLFLFPFYMLIVASTYSTGEISKSVSLMFGSYLVENFEKVLYTTDFQYYFVNSLYVAIFNVIITVSICLMCGYGVAKYQFKLKKFFDGFIIFTLMIPTSLGMIALVWELRQMDWMNSHLPLIFTTVANSFSVFWFRQMALDVPDEVLESARIDGSNEFRTFLRIAIPMMKPAIATVALIDFNLSWNNYMLPSIVIQDSKKFTLPVGIATFASMYLVDNSAKVLGTLLGIAPIIIIYILSSKYVINGITSVAVKG